MWSPSITITAIPSNDSDTNKSEVWKETKYACASQLSNSMIERTSNFHITDKNLLLRLARVSIYVKTFLKKKESGILFLIVSLLVSDPTPY